MAAVILGVTQEDGFALAGSGAIREHGLTDRPTQDVDLFTMKVTEALLAGTVDHAKAALTEHGYDASLARRAALFARLIVTKGDEQHRGRPRSRLARPHLVMFEIGPVLAIDDVVANKVGALHSGAVARDFLDVDSIRRSERFTDPRLLQLAAEHDPDSRRSRSPISSASSRQSTQAPSQNTAESLDGIRHRLLA